MHQKQNINKCTGPIRQIDRGLFGSWLIHCKNQNLYNACPRNAIPSVMRSVRPSVTRCYCDQTNQV